MLHVYETRVHPLPGEFQAWYLFYMSTLVSDVGDLGRYQEHTQVHIIRSRNIYVRQTYIRAEKTPELKTCMCVGDSYPWGIDIP